MKFAQMKEYPHVQQPTLEVLRQGYAMKGKWKKSERTTAKRPMLIGRRPTRIGQHSKCQITCPFGWNWKSTTQTIFYVAISESFTDSLDFTACCQENSREEQLREPVRRIRRKMKSTRNVAARLR